MLKYRRRPNSGKMFMQSRKGGHKQRSASMKTLYPGDEMIVERVEDLPGHPYAMDGWELVGVVEEEKKVPPKDYLGVGPCVAVAKLEAVKHGRVYKVVIAEPGLDQTAQDGVVLSKGTKIHAGYLNEETAIKWAELGYDPRETVNAS